MRGGSIPPSPIKSALDPSAFIGYQITLLTMPTDPPKMPETPAPPSEAPANTPAKGDTSTATAVEKELSDFVSRMAKFVGFADKGESVMEPPPTATPEATPVADRCPCPVCYMNPDFMGHS